MTLLLRFLPTRPRARSATFLTALLAWPLGACCVSPPLVSEWEAVGFRSPSQAIATFQTAVRADAPELEYRCFSTGFRARNGISKVVWREAREELRSRHPWLRKGLADARVEGAIDQRGDRATAQLVTHGWHIRVGLVREDYAELWAGDRLVSDEENVSFARQSAAQEASDGRVWVSGSVLAPAGFTPEDEVTEVHVGREWKIDSFENVDEPCAAVVARAARRTQDER